MMELLDLLSNKNDRVLKERVLHNMQLLKCLIQIKIDVSKDFFY